MYNECNDTVHLTYVQPYTLSVDLPTLDDKTDITYNSHYGTMLAGGYSYGYDSDLPDPPPTFMDDLIDPVNIDDMYLTPVNQKHV